MNRTTRAGKILRTEKPVMKDEFVGMTLAQALDECMCVNAQSLSADPRKI